MAKKQLTFGLIGCGKFGKHYARLLTSIPGATLAVVANRSADVFQKKMLPSSVRTTTKNEEIFKNPDIDCVVIATPFSSHYALAIAALRSGKHVLMEKPMVPTVKEASQLAKEVKKSGRVFMVGHQYLFNDYVRYLKRIIDAGKLGAIRYLFAEQLSFAPRKEGDCFWEQATHELAVIDYLFDSPRIIRAHGSAIGLFKARARDFAAAQIRFSQNLLAAIVVSWHAPKKIRRMIITGTKGLAFFDDCEEKNKLRFLFGQRSFVPRIRAQEPLRNQLNHFIHCVCTGAQPLTNIDHGVRITKWLSTISASLHHD